MEKNNLKILATYLPSLVFLIIVFLKLNTFGESLNVITWDTLGYYLYLPLLFIYNDISLQDTSQLEALIKAYHASDSFYQISRLENGNQIFKYSYGISLLLSPFYFIADFITVYFSNEKRDGFSIYYQNIIYIGGFIYTVIGALIIPKLLNKFFNWNIVVLTSIFFLFGTSYFFEASHSNLMPHNLLLPLYGLFILFTIKFHEKYEAKYALLLGFIFGLLVSSRPTEGIILLIPLLWNVKSIKELGSKFQFFSNNKLLIIIFSLSSFIVILPQLLYWRTFGGDWIITSYGNPAEGLDWLKPHTFDVLFSFRKGWFIYTPIAFIGVLSFYFLNKKQKNIILPLGLFFIINIYVVSAWSCWWYAYSFSMRALVQSSIILVFPLASSLHYFRNKIKTKIIFISVMSLLVCFNQFQIWQMEKGIIKGDRMTADYYFKVFGETKLDPDWENLLLVERSSDASDKDFDKNKFKVTNVINLSYEDSLFHCTDTISRGGNRSTFLTEEISYSRSINLSVKDITSSYYGWIEGEYWVYPTADPVANPFSIVYTFLYDGKAHKYRSLDSESLNLVPNQWNKISFRYLTPELRSPDDVFTTYVWNRGKQTVFIDDVKVTCYQEKE